MTGPARDVERNLVALHAVRSYKMQQAAENWELRCEVKNLEMAVRILDSALRMACEFIADYGDCPASQLEVEPRDCGADCDAETDRAECWRRYFIEGVSGSADAKGTVPR